VKLNKLAATVIATLSIPACYAGSIPYTADTAPDALSRSVLANPLTRPDEGAAPGADPSEAIHRNFPKVIEQNFASMPESMATYYINQLSDVELSHLAQLYVNANAYSGRQGKFLQLAALRLQGEQLGRMSRYFGHNAVRAAVARMAPQKLDSFESYSSLAYKAPMIGATPKMASTVSPEIRLALTAGAAGAAAAGGVHTMAGTSFTPSTSMTFDELYNGFRSMQVGSMATYGAVYETAMYAGRNLYFAWQGGQAVGSGITWVMQTYEPTFYYDSFVPWVGDTVTWVQNFATNVWNYASQSGNPLGSYQSSTLPTYGVVGSQSSSMGSMGGDWGETYEFETYTESLSGSKACRPPCKVWPQ